MKKFVSALLALVSSAGLVSAQTLTNYETAVTNQSPNYYFTFNGGSLTSGGTNANAITLASSPANFTQFGYDLFGNAGDTVYFASSSDGLVDTHAASDLVINSGGNGVAATNSTATGSISFLFKSLDPGINTGQKYVFSAGISNANDNALSLFFNNTNVSLGSATNSLQLRFGDSTTTLLPYTNIIPDTWYYFALTYTEATNGYFFDSTGTNLVTIKGKWYLGIPGSALTSGVTTNAINAVAGQGLFYIGNRPTLDEAYTSPGNGQVDEFATWARRLSDAEIQTQFTNLPALTIPARLGYDSVINAQSPSHYFTLDGTYADSVVTSLVLQTNLGPSSTLGFTYDYFGGPTNSVVFTVGGDALTNNGNLLNGGGTYSPAASGAGKGSLSFLFRTLNSYVNQGNRYLYQAGGSPGTSNRFELFFNTYSSSTAPEALRLGFGTAATTVLTTNNFLPATWYYFAMTYNEALTNNQVQWWLGSLGANAALTAGNLSSISNSLAGQGNIFVIGDSTNLVSNSYRNSTPAGNGRIQNFAIWNYPLTGTQVTNQFDALLSPPVTPPAAPVLSIAVAGSNLILSWPSSTDPGYGLQSTASLSSPSWSSAGASSVAGNQFVVTNALSSSAQFYRLQK